MNIPELQPLKPDGQIRVVMFRDSRDSYRSVLIEQRINPAFKWQEIELTPEQLRETLPVLQEALKLLQEETTP